MEWVADGVGGGVIVIVIDLEPDDDADAVGG